MRIILLDGVWLVAIGLPAVGLLGAFKEMRGAGRCWKAGLRISFEGLIALK